MKKLLLILLMLLLFSVAKSQQVTQVPTNVAKQIVKDLLSGDSAKAILELTNSQLRLTEQKVVAKDSVISVFRLKETNYLQQIEAEKSISSTWQQQYAQLQKDYKKQKVKHRFMQFLSTSAIGTLAYFYIVK
jgi:hypothetical protein